MALATRSSVFAFTRETTAGTPVSPAASDFTIVREGASISGAMNTVDSDELRNSIGASKSFATNQAPTGSIPHYFKPSGVEGQAPDYAMLIESCLGGKSVASTQYTTAASSTAGTSLVRGNLKVTAGVEANFVAGQALLIKDGVNGYAVRNVYSGITSTNLPLNWNLATPPAASVGLGKASFFYPLDGSQPTFTAHWFQNANSSAGMHLAMAGGRATAMNMEFVANELGTVTFDVGGASFYQNPIEITASSKYIDFTDSAGIKSAQLTVKTYSSPIELAREIASKLTAASNLDTISCSWSNTTGKFTISSGGSVLSLLWLTGTNTANSAKTKLGFSNSDDTGALTYDSDTAQTYNPSVTPVYDTQTPQVVRYNMFQIGTFSDYICASGSSLTISISAPKTDVPDWCQEFGIAESVVQSREVTFQATVAFAKHDVKLFDALINNTDLQLSFTHGQRSAGNWVPGKIVNVWLPQVSLTASLVADQDGYLVYQIEGKAYVGTLLADVYINFL